MHPKLTLFTLAIAAMVAVTASCKKDNNAPAGTTKHTDGDGTYLNEKNSFYLTREGNGGTVHVKFSGNTNADSIKYQTSGDGLISDVKVQLASDKTFNEDTAISFTATSVPSGTFTAGLTLKAYRHGDVLTVTLQSGNLSYQ
jgi:hypothetical protein